MYINQPDHRFVSPFTPSLFAAMIVALYQGRAVGRVSLLPCTVAGLVELSFVCRNHR
jgi:hypothetical protein